jgi:phosphopantetheine--protein transferase-like protein
VLIGIDIIDVADFKKRLERNSTSFLNKYFSRTELLNKDTKHLAGIFAAKEAIFKTGYLPTPDPAILQILSDASGKPRAYDINGNLIAEVDVSISHSKLSAVGIALWNNTNQ